MLNRKIPIKQQGQIVAEFELLPFKSKKPFTPAVFMGTNGIKYHDDIDMQIVRRKTIPELSDKELVAYYKNTVYCIEEEIVFPLPSYFMWQKLLRNELTKRNIKI